MSILKSIISNVLVALYQPFWFALLLSIVFMFVWKRYSSVKEAMRQWIQWFKKEESFRRMFLLVFYTIMILFRTLINRNMWLNPLSDVMGGWWIWKIDNKTGEQVLTTECFENLALFVPFTVLLFYTYRDKIVGEHITLGRILWKASKIVFLFSFTIEMLQLFLRLGTWQLSDLFYNTLGGFIGGMIYWWGYRIKNRMTST